MITRSYNLTTCDVTILALNISQVGDCFVVNYNNRNYEIEVREAKPGNAISVVETDCQVCTSMGWGLVVCQAMISMLLPWHLPG